jgi:Spy/CpxP family protein refolding chaperone
MTRVLLVAGLLLAFVAPLSAQDKKDPPKDPPAKPDTTKPDPGKPDTTKPDPAKTDPAKPTTTVRARGTLPQNWKQLGLTDEQKQKVYQIQTEFREKIDVLQKQVSDLRTAERKELDTVLTDPQRARLKEIVGGKVPGTDPKPAGAETKPGTEPKPDK